MTAVSALAWAGSRVAAAFTPPTLPQVSRAAFRFHMAYALLDATAAGILSNAPLMAVKAMGASDAQLQLPLVIASFGLFASVVTGSAMSKRPKKPFVVVPGIASAIAALVMAWTGSAGWFLAILGIISMFDFAIRPAMPSILRIIYPDHCRAHVAGTLRQYSSIVFLVSTLFFASLLASEPRHIHGMIHLQLTLAGLASLAAFLCFRQLPDLGDGSEVEARSGLETGPAASGSVWRFRFDAASLAPFRDRRFRWYLAIFFLFSSGNFIYSGIVPAYFARDLGLGYFQATLLIHIVPAVTGFLAGGRLTAWFDRTSVWRSYALVALMWGLDPVLLALGGSIWPIVAMARVIRGPSTVGSMVLAYYTGVHSFAEAGPDTSCYMAVFVLVNGMARFIFPSVAAVAAGHISHRMMLLTGGLVVLAAAAMFLASDARWPNPAGCKGSIEA
jgi:hypothetical protein